MTLPIHSAQSARGAHRFARSASARTVSVVGMALVAAGLAGCLGGAWSRAVDEDTPAAYYRFLREHPDSKHAADARERLEYHKLLVNPTLEGFERFRKSHPTSALLVNLKPALEKPAFERARGLGTSEAYRQFLTDYPDGKLSARAIGNATYLEARGFGGDAVALADFASIHPESDYASEASRTAETVAARSRAGFDRLGIRFAIDPSLPEARRVRATLSERINELAMRAGIRLVTLPDLPAPIGAGTPGVVLEVRHREQAVDRVTPDRGIPRPGVLGVTQVVLRDVASGHAIAERSFEIRVVDKAFVPGTSVLFSAAAPRYWQEFFVPFARWSNDSTVRPAIGLARPVVDVASAGDRTVVLFEDGDFEILDLADPAKPVTLARYDRGESYMRWAGVRVIGDRIALFGDEGLEIVRIERGVPKVERSWTRGQMGRVLGIAAVGRELVVVGAKGMQAVDLETGAIRRAMRRVLQSVGAAGESLVFVDGDSIYVSNLELLVDERVIAQIKLGRTFGPSRVRVIDRTAIVMGPGGTVVLDIAVADQPRIVGKLFSREIGEIRDAAKIGGRIYLVGQRGLEVLTSRLDGVEETVDVGARSRVAAMGRHLVTADRQGLQVVDASPWSAQTRPASPAP